MKSWRKKSFTTTKTSTVYKVPLTYHLSVVSILNVRMCFSVKDFRQYYLRFHVISKVRIDFKVDTRQGDFRCPLRLTCNILAWMCKHYVHIYTVATYRQFDDRKSMETCLHVVVCMWKCF